MVLGLLLTMVLGYGITKLQFATGTDSYLNADEQVYKDSIDYQRRFGGEANLTVITMDEGHKVDELFTNEANRSAIEKTSASIRKISGVRGVIDPLVALDLSGRLIAQNPDEPTTANILGSVATGAVNDALLRAPEKDKAARSADLAATTAKVLAIPEEERFVGKPAWTAFLLYDNQGEIRLSQRAVFPDDRHAVLITRFKGNMKVDAATSATNQAYKLVDGMEIENAKVATTGAPKLLVEINDYLRGGMLSLGAIAVGIMVIILLVLFDVRWRLLPLFTVLIGVVWAFGIAGYTGIPLTLVTVAGLPVMLGIGIDYAIQMHARVEEEAIIDHNQHPIQETARNLCPALLVVTFDALFAFAALHWAAVPMLRDFGILLAVGVAVICFASIVIPLAALGIREFRSPTKGADFREGALGRAVVKVGSLPSSFALPLALLSIAVFVGGAFVEEKLHIQTDPVKWVNPDSQVIKNLRYAEKEIGSSSELGVMLKAGPEEVSQDTVDYLDQFTTTFRETYPKAFPTASSIVAIVGDLLVVPGTDRVHPRAADVSSALKIAPRDIRTSTFEETAKSKAFNTVFLTGPGSLEDRKVMVGKMKSYVKLNPLPTGESLTPSGLVVVGVGLLDNLTKNRILLTYLAIAFVALFLAVRMRSVVRSLLSLVPVLIAVGVSSLLAWAFQWELSPMTAVGGPLVVAACTEFTSLILLRFVEERGRGLNPQEAVDVAAARTGRAFIVSAMTAIAGVAVISFSSMPLLRDFGRIVGMNVAVALISALVFLPPMLVWADKRNWVSKGMIHEHDEPYIETPAGHRL
jgi:hydrophobe/amphiphile efflux-3 (HAE3) family protein